MSEAMIDTLVAGGLTRTQAYAVFRLGADVHCRRVFDRAIACQRPRRVRLLAGGRRGRPSTGPSRRWRREGDGSAAEGPGTKAS